jgi:hypothetical protein
MAQGLFTTGFTVQEVLDIQAKAKQALLEGKTVMSWSDSGLSVSKQFALSVKETLEECAYALRVLDPETYGKRKSTGVSGVYGYLAK